MSENKEKNFVSAVVYLGDDEELIAPFLSAVSGKLTECFERYEIICVNDANSACALAVREWAKNAGEKAPVTVVNMSVRQGTELCMNAGIDIAIGDYVFEFDSPALPFDPSLIMECYHKSQEGFDIVTAAPRKAKKLTSRLFYSLFNANSKSVYKLRTDSFHVLSRRAVNRLHAINPNMPYRKAAYAASGLRLAMIEFDPAGDFDAHRDYRATQAIDALVLYTDAAYKLSLGVSLALLLVTLASAVYTVVIYFGSKKPIEGWTTTMILMAAGFFGVFLLFVIKYLSILIELVFKNQKYLVESVEKIQYE